MLRGKKFLITCGPTWVPIDNVRVISNISSGELGHLIAQKLRKAHAQVTIIEGKVTHKIDDKSIKRIPFTYFDELEAALKKELRKKYDCVIHAAAVSDYQLKKKASDKISSDKKNLTLKLSPTAKLIEKIKKINPKALLVGFKLNPYLTKNNIIEKSKYLFTKAHCDLVVSNSIRQNQYQAFIVNKEGKILTTVSNKKDLANQLLKVLNTHL